MLVNLYVGTKCTFERIWYRLLYSIMINEIAFIIIRNLLHLIFFVYKQVLRGRGRGEGIRYISYIYWRDQGYYILYIQKARVMSILLAVIDIRRISRLSFVTFSIFTKFNSFRSSNTFCHAKIKWRNYLTFLWRRFPSNSEANIYGNLKLNFSLLLIIKSRP